MKRFLLTLCIVLALTACKDEKKTTSQIKENQVIKIGVIYPMTGEYAHFGDSMKVAIKLFEKDKKTQDSSFKYKFFIEDNAFSPSRSAIVAKKLIEMDHVDVIITLNSDVGSVVSPIAQENKVIHFSMATEPNVAKGEYNFTVSTPPSKNTGKLEEELQRQNLTNVAYITQNTAMMESVAEYIRKIGTRGKVNILSDNAVNSGERDFRILIHKILKDKPDAIIIQLQPPELQIFVKQLREIDKDIAITSIEAFSYPKDKTLFEGKWYVGAVVPTKDYVNEYQKLTGSDTTNISELFYATSEVIREAYTSGNKSEVINNILNLKMKSFSIGDVTFDQNGMMQADAYLYTIKNGQIEVIEE